jgi:hypothetical protein
VVVIGAFRSQDGRIDVRSYGASKVAAVSGAFTIVQRVPDEWAGF